MKTLIRYSISFAIAALSMAAQAAPSPEAKILNSEFERLYSYVSDLKADGTVDGYLKYKIMDGYELLWNLEADGNSYDTITLYRDEFAVRYYRSKYIIKGREILRRFIGPHITGWRNDSIDVQTGQYLGYQGFVSPQISAEDQKLLDAWKIKAI